MGIAIARCLIDQLLAEAAAEPDREVCGLLFGNGGAILHVAPTANVAAYPADSFEIDPQALFAAIRAERNGGPRLIGHYHSHPRGRPDPSPRDAAAAEPGRLWLILGSGEARLWQAEAGGRFTPVPLLPC
jgi:proteasome lid subunit RPN8/RPN11